MVILGLGSNCGDRVLHLQSAVAKIGKIVVDLVCSPIYESAALLPEGAPLEWDITFLNMALCCKTILTPQQLLLEIKAIEKKLGRVERGHWGPREIDIDILAYDDLVINEENLIIPHAHLTARDFALIPLADIAPDWVYPAKGNFYGKTAREIAGSIANNLTKTSYTLK